MPLQFNIKQITEAIDKVGYIVINNALPDKLIDELYQRITSLNSTELQDAKIGSNSSSKLIKKIRNDKTCWLDGKHETDHKYLSLMENLRLLLNRCLFMGLFEYECHYAVYQPGSYYKKHSDVLGTTTESNPNKNRILSSVLYLNKNWNNNDGGELILYNKKDDSKQEILYPENNNLVLFLSEQFPHEVNTTKQVRYSITGWFRVNKIPC